MLKLSNVTLRRGLKVLFSQAELTIHKGQRIGVTGANGAGKSSLFSLFLGQLEADEGEVTASSGLVYASTDQEITATERVAREYVIDGDQYLRKLETDLARVEAAGEGGKHATLLAEYESAGGYTATARAATLLNGLGFSDSDQARPLSDFSGGWRMRLNLAKALMCPSDVLLLDEPTNHLDLDAVLWLESWLNRYSGTLLLISHDREFLDRVCTHISHIEQKGVRLYTGNYSEFEKQRTEALAAQQANYVRQQREIAHMQDFVRRFKAKATKAKQAQSRVKALERMEVIGPAHVDSEFHFQFLEPAHLPSPLVTLEDVDCGYGDKKIIAKANIRLQSGDKIGLLGMNGAGKSTFVRTLVGDLEALQGQIKSSPHLRVGYFAQHQLEQLPDDGTPMSYLQALDAKATEASLRDFAGGFGFRGDMVFAHISTMSGGEKARLVLAGIVYQKPNFLILDEPTNHLDIDMRHALTMALQEFDGALVIVSHDRHLLRCCSDELWLVAGGKLSEFNADLDAYTDWLTEQRRQDADTVNTPGSDGENSSFSKKERKRLQAEARKRIQPLKKAAQKLEKQVDETTTKLAKLEEQLSDTTLYEAANKEQLQALMRDQAALKKAHEELEMEWLEAMEALENAENPAIG